ncbi:hypothetical protein Hte_011612 [Hypoxylon texense]
MGKFGIDSDLSASANSVSSKKRGSIRQRFTRGLNNKKSILASQQAQAQDSTDSEGTQKENVSFIRKSIGSISSSLKGRLSSEYSTGGEARDRRPSVIRKSFGSMSSSLRGIRSSVNPRPSLETGERALPVRYHTISGALGRTRSRKYNNLRRLSCDASEHEYDSVPRLPALEDMIANAQVEKTTLRVPSPPNSLLGMFDALNDGPFNKTWHGPLAVRLKYSGTFCPESNVDADVKTEAVADTYPTLTSTPKCCENTSDQATSSQRGLPISRVPLEWLDHILETSITTRDEVIQMSSPPRRPDTNGGWNSRVYVRVPDETDHRKPWPKRSYPDLKSALDVICGRLKPFYAPFAAYTDTSHVLQLFPPEFNLNFCTKETPHTTFFDMQETLDIFNELISITNPPFDEGNSEPTELASDSESEGS